MVYILPISLMAQVKINEGKVYYDISYTNLSPNLKMKENQMPHDATFYFKNEKSRIEMNAGPFGKNITITDKLKKQTTILINIYGKKFALIKSDSEMAEVKKSMITDTTKANIKIELTNETKKIAGYTCQQAFIVKTIKGTTTKNECWYSKDIPPYNTEGDEAFKQIDGFLMQYDIKNPDMEMRMKVKIVFANPIEDSYFEIPKGYQVVTETQLTNILNLMQQDGQ